MDLYVEYIMRNAGLDESDAGIMIAGRNIHDFGYSDDLATQFSPVQSLSCVWLFVTPWTAARRAFCPSPTPRVYSNSCPLSWWCHPTISFSVPPLLLLPSTFPRIRVFSNESALRIRWPKYWIFSFSISPPNEHPGLISFRMDWLDLLAVQGTL